MSGRNSGRDHGAGALIPSFFFLAFFGLGLSRAFTLSASYVYLLTVFAPETLPLVHVGAACSVPMACWIFLRLERRVPYMRLLAGYVVAVVVTAAFWLGLRLGGWSTTGLVDLGGDDLRVILGREMPAALDPV